MIQSLFTYNICLLSLNLTVIRIYFCYSDRNELTGFAIAALIAWKLTVINAINKDSNPITANIFQPMLIL